MKKTAVILFNLGGPDRQEAVEPFLFNLFSDRAIIRLPQPFRYLIAKLISRRRAKIAQAIYDKLGGGSPILANTQAQSIALQKLLNADPRNHNYKTFVAMRYWHPFAEETAHEVARYAPDEIILLPLYPQFSTTTTASSIDDWKNAASKFGLVAPTKFVCCYPEQIGFIRALSENIRSFYEEAKGHGKPRILFSAHGLPEKIVAAGDPYPSHCARTAEALKQELAIENLDYVLCYQSRVGPLKWIGPSTDEEILRAGNDKIPLVVAPIAFVSDHSETLVEIDIEYRRLAMKNGVPYFACVPAVGTAPDFIVALAQLVLQTAAQEKTCLPGSRTRICDRSFTGCPCE